ncbi:biotin transporter BioY [Defluviitalea phaphyphila]|uniref:biotin transporter BioY n=1 Tax=Defluviitalea phaphyphila TaxID=1473580 RepID=UPI000A01E07C|nr:biotin transporter BioY [Defluviitalea phaphyphila]
MKNTKNLILVGIFAALTAVGAFIKIPIPYVPFTLQYLFCALAGIILGSKLGALSQIIYVAVGLAGVPVTIFTSYVSMKLLPVLRKNGYIVYENKKKGACL